MKDINPNKMKTDVISVLAMVVGAAGFIYYLTKLIFLMM
jgi:preprotein translocase subunit SecE